MKILFIVTNINSANGICALKVAEECEKKGHDVFILTQNDDGRYKYGRKTNIKIVSLNGCIKNKRAHISDNINLKLSKFVDKIAGIFNKVKVIILYPVWPISNLTLSRKLFLEAEKLMSEENINLVIPIYNSIEALIAGKKLKDRYEQIYYIPYLLDSFYGGQRPRLMPQKIRDKKALKWEDRLFRNADSVIAMRSCQNLYINLSSKPNYFSKMIFLDLPLLEEINTWSDKRNKYFNEKETIFLFVGSMPRNIRNPENLLTMFKCINKKDWVLYLVGTSDYEKQINIACKGSANIRKIGSVTNDVAKEMLGEADFLINIGNSLNYMVPSKIFEYMSYNKPIISTSKLKEDPSKPYLEVYKNSLLLNENASANFNAEKVIEFVELQKNKKERRTFLKETEKAGKLYKNTPKAFVECIERIYLSNKCGEEKCQIKDL